ncbi:Hypothetical protein A7982_09060 [Minicystis rosea]|nr:Hypothetical protein A7982_09060 [Minicystis rosea]
MCGSNASRAALTSARRVARDGFAMYRSNASRGRAAIMSSRRS